MFDVNTSRDSPRPTVTPDPADIASGPKPARATGRTTATSDGASGPTSSSPRSSSRTSRAPSWTMNRFVDHKVESLRPKHRLDGQLIVSGGYEGGLHRLRLRIEHQ